MGDVETRTAVRWALVAIVLAGMAVRLAFAGLPRVVRWDEAAYQMIARSLLAGQGYAEVLGAPDLQQPPMVVYISFLGLKLGLPAAWATAAFAHVILGGLLALPVYGLTRALPGKGHRAAWIAALLVAVYPALAVSPLYWSTMTEPPYLFFITTGIYGIVRAARGGGWGWGLWVGAAFGLAYLTRPEAVAYLIVMLLLLVASPKPRPCPVGNQQSAMPETAGHTVGNRQSVAAAILVFVTLAAPYVVYLHSITGRWALSGKQGISIDIAAAYVRHDQAAHDRAVASLDSTGREILWLSAEQYDKSLLNYIAEDPRRFAWHVRQNMMETWQALFHQDLFSPWIVALMALGLFTRPWTRQRAWGELVLLLALAPLASLWVFFVLSRFLGMAVVVGLIWAAAGLEHFVDCRLPTVCPAVSGIADWQVTNNTWITRSAILRAWPLVLTVVALLWAGADVVRREQPQQPYAHVEAGQWLAAHVPPESIVMARDTEVALYAGLPAIAFPNAEWPQVVAYARARGARYLAIDQWTIVNIRPQLGFLLETDRLPPEVRFLTATGTGSRVTYVYELVTW